ncbi:hypothetical protein BC939DRAFT_437895 [Gamsiella multidivaricata]|uniref:uncharacterized protein n=1 Tax=Gamsiella multidivaricata TaxID=101098 RepID=UPI002220FCBF|nr:uncharacterized protein BC939DRAFT_437895 [Gamsiella multidivaricata]KAG0358841.1 hypothetical protein BGZ54_010254 [Gamsiella multidivaricata]KAI7831196.1 hypothetical protein BC939DRAFT_437895 [Gamsiella multidivaricata]
MPKVKATSVPSKKAAAVDPPKKKMSAYNTFMKEELPKYKAKHAGVEHKEAFKQVAIMWKNSPQNPKRAQ